LPKDGYKKENIYRNYQVGSLGKLSPVLGSAQLSAIFTKTEGKLPDNGTTPTRAQFLIMQSLFDSINNLSL